MNLQSLLASAVPIEDALVLSSGLAVLLALLAIWHGMIERDPIAQRVRALAERREALRAGARGQRANRARDDLRQRSLSFMRHVVTRFNLLRGRQIGHIVARLSCAGYRSKDALIVYLFAKAILPLTCGGGSVLLLQLMRTTPPTSGLRLLALCFGLGAGFYGVDIFIKNQIDKRKTKLRKSLPDALDLLVICAEAGLSLDAATSRVGRELMRAHPELADEFSLTALELRFLPDRKQALQNLVTRTDLAELRSLVNALIQTERYGTTLAQSLRVLSNEFREERLMRAEEKAAKLPATMTVPMIVFILPALFIVIGGPAFLRIIDTLSHMKM